MGQVITRNASTARIMDVSFRTQTRATAHGGEVQTLVESRLGVLNVALTTVDQQLTEASATDDAQHAVLMARDSESALDIRQTNHPRLVEKKESRATRIEQKAPVQAQAAEPLDAHGISEF